MTNYNKVFLIGRLTKEPETKVTMSGISLSRFTIAVNRLKKAGEESVADFINIVTWRRLAEVASQYLKKGQLVAIEGELRIDSYDRNGESREWVEVVADNFQMLDRVTADMPVSEGIA